MQKVIQSWWSRMEIRRYLYCHCVSVLLRISTSCYSFGISKLFLSFAVVATNLLERIWMSKNLNRSNIWQTITVIYKYTCICGVDTSIINRRGVYPQVIWNTTGRAAILFIYKYKLIIQMIKINLTVLQ